MRITKDGNGQSIISISDDLPRNPNSPGQPRGEEEFEMITTSNIEQVRARKKAREEGIQDAK
jgi:hypothetical protein